MMDLFNVKNKACSVCLMKDELIDSLMKERSTPCIPCKNYELQVKYLKEQVEKGRQDWREAQAEFKRAVDRIMETIGSHPIGQGALPQSTRSEQMSELEKMTIGIFEDTELDEQGMKKSGR